MAGPANWNESEIMSILAVAPSRRDLLCGLPLMLLLAACQPTVKVETPKEPITINLNIKLDAEVRVKLEEQAESDIATNPDIF